MAWMFIAALIMVPFCRIRRATPEQQAAKEAVH